MGFEPTTPTLARYWVCFLSLCDVAYFYFLFGWLPTRCPSSLELRHRRGAMRGAHRGVAFDHAQRFPAALLTDGLEVDV
jgi:hypothetical protein